MTIMLLNPSREPTTRFGFHHQPRQRQIHHQHHQRQHHHLSTSSSFAHPPALIKQKKSTGVSASITAQDDDHGDSNKKQKGSFGGSYLSKVVSTINPKTYATMLRPKQVEPKYDSISTSSSASINTPNDNKDNATNGGSPLNVQQFNGTTKADLVELQFQLLSSMLENVVAQRPTLLWAHRRLRRGDLIGQPTPHLVQDDHHDATKIVVDELTEMFQFVPHVGCGSGTGSHRSSFSLGDGSLSSTDSEPFESIPSSQSQILTRACAVTLSDTVKAQLRLYISIIASMYVDENPFHNFDHACHVTFSAYELLRRVITSSNDKKPRCDSEGEGGRYDDKHGRFEEQAPVTLSSTSDPWKDLPFDKMAEYADGLQSDALAQFAVVFSALIHDVDHQGISNSQLAKEHPEVATKYRNKSLAEQNSVDVAWTLLMESDDFVELRAAMFPHKVDRQRFRQMVVNIVMSTDICDPELRQFQDQKWEKAFHCTTSNGVTCSHGQHQHSVEASGEEEEECKSRKTTVVMELIMQAADVSHTMQSFGIYRLWNQRLFYEMYTAYLQGRSSFDPTSDDGSLWYNGELLFFDKHIIPLAKRLQQCQVFGSAGDAILSNAHANRKEWERHGSNLFRQMTRNLLQQEVTGIKKNNDGDDDGMDDIDDIIGNDDSDEDEQEEDYDMGGKKKLLGRKSTSKKNKLVQLRRLLLLQSNPTKLLNGNKTRIGRSTYDKNQKKEQERQEHQQQPRRNVAGVVVGVASATTITVATIAATTVRTSVSYLCCFLVQRTSNVYSYNKYGGGGNATGCSDEYDHTTNIEDDDEEVTVAETNDGYDHHHPYHKKN